jgi:serine/threonine-protein kinase RIM15
MAENQPKPTLAPPVVTALKQEAAATSPTRGRMERTVSEDIRQETDDLKEAAEHNPNVIMDLGLRGTIRFVSPSWKDVVGTLPEDVVGTPIAELLLENHSIFVDTIAAMKEDDSRSHMIRFRLRMGPHSRLGQSGSPDEEDNEETPRPPESPSEDDRILDLEAQGIMIYDRATGEQSHVSRLYINLTLYRC